MLAGEARLGFDNKGPLRGYSCFDRILRHSWRFQHFHRFLHFRAAHAVPLEATASEETKDLLVLHLRTWLTVSPCSLNPLCGPYLVMFLILLRQHLRYKHLPSLLPHKRSCQSRAGDYMGSWRGNTLVVSHFTASSFL